MDGMETHAALAYHKALVQKMKLKPFAPSVTLCSREASGRAWFKAQAACQERSFSIRTLIAARQPHGKQEAQHDKSASQLLKIRRAMPKDAAGNLVVGEKEATATRAVIWLHGFGDSPEGWAMAWQPLQGLTSWSWHHLCAPLLEQPCYGNKKLRGWGQFHTQEVIHVGSTDYIDEDKGGSYAASVAMVLAEIEKLEKRMPSEQVLIGGFSQGAAIALHCALQHSRPLAGCVAVSGWLTASARRILSDGWKGSTSFLLCHGTADDMVGFDC